jgi:hypothetical protein
LKRHECRVPLPTLRYEFPRKALARPLASAGMKRWHWIVLAALTIVSVPAQFAGEPHHAWDRVPAFWAIFGLLGAGLLMAVSKGLGRFLVQKKEDYYDES